MSEARTRQYPPAKSLNLQARLKLVARLTTMGLSHHAIANELDYSVRQAKIDVAAITDQISQMDDFEEFLRDATRQVREQLIGLKRLRESVAKQLDWAEEWVPQYVVLLDGSSVIQKDHHNQEIWGPRKPGTISQLVGQIAQIDRQIAELLGLLSKNVDITIKLSQTERVQTIVLNVIREQQPEVYAQLRQEIDVALSLINGDEEVKASQKMLQEPPIDAEFKEVS